MLRIPGTVKIPMLSHSTVLRIPETVKIPIISPSTLLRIPETVKIPILSHSTVLRTPESDFAVRRIQRSHIYLSKFVFKYLDETESQYLTVLACLSGELGWKKKTKIRRSRDTVTLKLPFGYQSIPYFLLDIFVIGIPCVFIPFFFVTVVLYFGPASQLIHLPALPRGPGSLVAVVLAQLLGERRANRNLAFRESRS